MDWRKDRRRTIQDSQWGSSVDTHEARNKEATLFTHEDRDGSNQDSQVDPDNEHMLPWNSMNSYTNCEQEITELDTKQTNRDMCTYSEDEFEDIESDTAIALDDIHCYRHSSKEEYKGGTAICADVTVSNGIPRTTTETETVVSKVKREEPVGSLGSSVDEGIIHPYYIEDGAGDVLEGAGGCKNHWLNRKARTELHLTNKLSIEHCDLKGKRVLIRADYDVRIKNGAISDPSRIAASLPTILYAFYRGAKSVVLISHLGRPEGRVDTSLSLRPVAELLEKQLNKPVTFLEDCVGPMVESLCANPPRGSVILLENLRFHVEEEGLGFDVLGQQVLATDEQVKQFRASLTKLADVYVNDAFTTIHKAHSSVVGCAMKQRACGLILRKELDCYSQLLLNSRKPFLAIVGGAKLSDKFLLLENLMNHVTEIIIGGGIAFIFLKILLNVEIGDTLFDDKWTHDVLKLMEQAERNGIVVHLPVDFLAADRYAESANVKKCSRVEGIPAGMVGVDLGDRTNKLFAQVISRASTVVWSGPPGVFEWDVFSHGTREMMDAVVQATEGGATTVLVGGDTVTCALKFGTQDMVSHLGTGNGAVMEILEGKILPGIYVLSRAPPKLDELDRLRIDQCCFNDQRVIIRSDFNVPIRKGKIINTDKIQAALPTIRYVMDKDPMTVVLISHMGCPNGHPAPEYSLKPVAEELERRLGRRVIFVESCVGCAVEKTCFEGRSGSIFLLENLGFHVEEVGSCIGQDGRTCTARPEAVQMFRKMLSRLGDIFINDAFSSTHTEHSSVVGINVQVKAAGYLLLKELELFQKVLNRTKRPILVIFGGSRVADKIVLMDKLLDLADDVIIAGGLALTFLKVLHGTPIGDSAYDQSGAQSVHILAQKALINGARIHLPRDFIIANTFADPAQTRTRDVTAGIPDGWMGLDVGEKTRVNFADVIGRAGTIVWSGPQGVCETDSFSGESEAMMEAVVKATQNGALSILEGEATLACCRKSNSEHKVSRICRDGGPSIELLLGNSLPGVAFLDPRKDIKQNTPQRQKKKTMKNKRAEPCPMPEDKRQTVPLKWTPPYTKKLPPLQPCPKRRPPVKYTGAPPPGKSIPSPYNLFKRKLWQQSSSSPSCSRHADSPHRSSYVTPRPTFLPPISPTSKPRVPVQLESLATLDARDNLTVHINGDSKDIPEEAHIKVTLVQGFIPMEKQGHQVNNQADQNESSQLKKTRTLSECETSPRLSEFKRKINLSSLHAEYRQSFLDNLPARGRTSRLRPNISPKTDVQCRKLSLI